MPRTLKVPGARALLGGLLMSVAAILTFVVWADATARSDEAYVVAAHEVHPGERLSPGDVELAQIGVADGSLPAFSEVDDVIGRIVLGPIAEGELVQPGQVTEVADEAMHSEVSFTLPRDRAVDGRLRSGDWVDVVVTEGDATWMVLERVRVISASEETGFGGRPGGEVVLTVGLDGAAGRLELIHALNAGEVTLTRNMGSA